MLHNHARLVHFFSVADGVSGRKKLQKMIYILQKAQIPFAEKFQYQLYGPYSEELTLRVEELCNLHLIEESKEDKGNYYRYNYTITDDGKAFLDQFTLNMPDFSEQVESLQSKSARFLELVATMLYFDYLSEADVEEKIQVVKPKQKYTPEELAEAWVFIEFMHKSVH